VRGCVLSGLAVLGLGGLTGPGGRGCRPGPREPRASMVSPDAAGGAVAAARREPSQCGMGAAFLE